MEQNTMKYTITVKEVHDSYVEIEADSPEQAIEKVKAGEGEEVSIEYNRTLDSETWNVHENDVED